MVGPTSGGGGWCSDVGGGPGLTRAHLGGQFDPRRRQVFVIGNEAADVDSLVSAYVGAALVEGAEAQGLAVSQIPRAEFRLRGDALALFRHAGSELAGDGSPARLRFWDEVDWSAVDELDRRSVVLTDHNRMAEKVAAHFRGRVEWILDHHASTGSHPEARAEIVEGLGSACTMVAEQLLSWPGQVPKELGTLLAGVILLDNRNFNPKEAKGIARDREAFDRLAEFVPEMGARAWYEELMRARKDISHLGVGDLLKLDMKIADAGAGSRVAWCSVFDTLDAVCARAGGADALQAEMRAFAAERGCDAAVAMFAKDATGLKTLAMVPLEPGGRGEAVCLQMAERLLGAPGVLPQALRENDLFAKQGILEHGFGLLAREHRLPLRAFSLRGVSTRKTVMPCAMGQES